MDLTSIWTNITIGAIGYIIGSISFSIILAKWFHKEDIRSYGSGNAGATNTTRAYGSKEGFFVFCLDCLKVLVPVVIAFLLKRYEVLPNSGFLIVQIAGFMAFIGHLYPIFHKFKGGKGVSCFFGFLLSFNIVLAIIFVGIYSFIAFKWKMISLASVTGPPIIFCISWVPWFQSGILTVFFGDNAWWLTSFLLILMAMIIIYKHIPNIKRILKEEESTINQILSK